MASQIIDSSGGMVAVAMPGDPLDGFVIDVPPGSFTDSRTFKISSAPITDQSFGSDINPLSPMITVDNGGGYADKIMSIRVPVKVPRGHFAMGFLYDEKTKQLEGLPLVGKDAASVTIATRHFSSFFISMIEDALLKKNIDSGFLPGVDDWQFANYGSYISPHGHCDGQSLTALWYYFAKPDGNTPLYMAYDNNGDRPATPDFWQDDSLGYRLASTVQEDVNIHAESNWAALAGISLEWKNNKWESKVVPGISDETTRDLFAYSMQATGQPQEVIVRSSAGGGHALICYQIAPDALYVADPNFPGNTERKIEYGDGKFKPYYSGDDKSEIDAGKGKVYEKVIYQANWTIVSFDKISQRWAEFKKKTVGSDRFPAYLASYQDAQNRQRTLRDGLVSPNKLIRIASVGIGWTSRTTVFKGGVKLPLDAQGHGELTPGNNMLGILIEGNVDGKDQYVNFKYYNVIYGSLSIEPARLDGEPDKQYAFTAQTDFPPTAGARYEWYVDGAPAQSGASGGLTAGFKAEGGHQVSVKLIDGTGKEIREAQATVTISSGSQPVLHIDWSALENLRTNQTFTLTASVENIPASVSKLKFRWYNPWNACLPSDPPVQKVNAWYHQIVTPVNGKATCSITLKENDFHPPGQAYSSPVEKLQLFVEDEPNKKIVFLSAEKDYRVKQ